MMGVALLQAPQNWQVLQQQEGYGAFAVTTAIHTDSEAPCTVMARVCKETTGESVTDWLSLEQVSEKQFSGEICGIPVGGPYRLETCLASWDATQTHKYTRGDLRFHIYVGDVYVIAGQSNAAGRGRRPVFDPSECGVHMLRNNGIWDLAAHPLNDCTDTVFPESAEKLNPGHSPWLEFGRVVKQAVGVPIGLIPSAKGGTPLSAWNPCEDGYLYRSMMERIRATGENVRGVLWYQGCADAESAETARTYGRRFTEMVECLRKDLSAPQLPVFTVQINRFMRDSTPENDVNWGIVREVQRMLAKTLPHVFVVPSNDLQLTDAIHNESSSNLVLGRRVAQKVLSELYQKHIPGDAPDISSAVLEADGRLTLAFDHVYGTLQFYDAAPELLPVTVVSGSENTENPITAYEIQNNRIILTTRNPVREDSRIHIAWQQCPNDLIPKDSATFLPVLSCYGVNIQSNGI